MQERRDVLSDFSHLRDVATQVAALIADMRKLLDSASDTEGEALELEARLGKMHEGTFVSDVGHANFSALLQLLQSYPRWSRVTEWHESQDVYYHVALSGTGARGGDCSKTLVRSCVGANANGDFQVQHSTKQRLANVDMQMRLLDADSCSVGRSRGLVPGQAALDIRVSTSIERALSSDLLPIAVCPETVRIKQRKRFFLTSLGVVAETFSFDLSVVYTGKTKSEAEKKQSTQSEPRFEVEVECLAPRQYLQSRGGEDIMLALSLILKCHDLASSLTPGSVTYVPAVPFPQCAPLGRGKRVARGSFEDAEADSEPL